MTNPTPPEPDAKPTAAPAPGKPGVFVATKSSSVLVRSADSEKVEPPRMTEDTRRTPEQIAQRISGEFAAITEACPEPHCYVCADCEVKIEEAIAAALSEQDAEIAQLKAELDEMHTHWCGACDFHHDDRLGCLEAAEKIRKSRSLDQP